MFYHYSPLNRANLKKSAEALAQPCLIPIRVGGTRWMAHTLTSLDNFLRGYTVLKQHLGQVSKFRWNITLKLFIIVLSIRIEKYFTSTFYV